MDWMVQAVKSINATNVERFIHLSQKEMDIQPKHAYWRYACMWKGAVMAQLDACWRSIHKVSPIGSTSTPPNYPLLPYRTRSGRRNWTSCTLLSERKKRNLCSHGSGSRHTLCSKLGCRASQNNRNVASLFGARSPSQAVLQWRFSRVWQLVLWRSLWNANRQTGNLLGGSGQRRFASLLETFSAQVQMFLPKNAITRQKHSTLRVLLQPTTTYETPLSKILLSLDRLLITSGLVTPNLQLYALCIVLLL